MLSWAGFLLCLLSIPLLASSEQVDSSAVLRARTLDDGGAPVAGVLIQLKLGDVVAGSATTNEKGKRSYSKSSPEPMT